MAILEITTLNRTIRDFYQKNKDCSTINLYCVIEEEILPGEVKFIDLGIRCKIKKFNFSFFRWFKNKSIWKNCNYIVLPQVDLVYTPLIMKNSIHIQYNNKSSIKIPVINFSADPYTIKKGDCLFQLARADFKPIQKIKMK